MLTFRLLCAALLVLWACAEPRPDWDIPDSSADATEDAGSDAEAGGWIIINIPLEAGGQ